MIHRIEQRIFASGITGMRRAYQIAHNISWVLTVCVCVTASYKLIENKWIAVVVGLALATIIAITSHIAGFLSAQIDMLEGGE